MSGGQQAQASTEALGEARVETRGNLHEQELEREKEEIAPLRVSGWVKEPTHKISRYVINTGLQD